MASKGKFAIGALIAAGVGYLAGILTAPKSGKETRKDIKHAAEVGVSEAKKRASEIHEQLSAVSKEIAEQASVLTGKAKEEIQKAASVAATAKDKIAKVIQNGKSSDKDLDRAAKEAQAALDNLKKFLTTK